MLDTSAFVVGPDVLQMLFRWECDVEMLAHAACKDKSTLYIFLLYFNNFLKAPSFIMFYILLSYYYVVFK
jgi:hypothetical protein